MSPVSAVCRRRHGGSIWVVLDRCLLAFDKHLSSVAQAVRHIRHLLTMELAQSLTCIVWSCQEWTTATLCSMDFLLTNTGQCSYRHRGYQIPSHYTLPAALVDSQTADLLQVGCADVQRSHHFNSVVYLSRRHNVRTLRVSSATALIEPFASTDFTKRAFRCSAPAVWNALPCSVTDSDSLAAATF